MNPRKFYITTPIYYPNAEPHLGHVYTTICADTVARYHRLCGEDVYFLTGTDEHGVKMVKTAEARGVEPGALADSVVETFKATWREYGITHDDFIRTTEPRHKEAVQEIVRRLLANGDIYLGAYEGWYDEGQEEFVTETEAKTAEYKSAVSGRPLVRYKEPTYFFKLSKYVPKVIEYIEANEGFIHPTSRRNEVLSKLRQGVEDLSVSRATLKWGIPMPNDPDHVLYVWIDALSNYVTALGYPLQSDGATERRSDAGGGDPSSLRGSVAPSLFDRYWPADVHLIGKEIMWFHTVYWPAMLMSLGLALPRQVYAHGWWTADGKKMSKSMGNFIDLEKLRSVTAVYGRDALRYYLLRAATFGNDLDWSDAEFQTAYNKELADVLGNLLNRVVSMVGKYRGGILPAVGERDAADDNVMAATAALPDAIARAYEGVELQQCAMLPIETARAGNGYIEATAPFKLAKDPARSVRLDTVLNLAAQAVYRAFVALLPILPEKATAALRQLGVDAAGRSFPELIGATLPAGQPIGPPQPLFPKPDAKSGK
jgi:methionyl-tRNA synthetase